MEDKITLRLKKIRGQIDGIIKMYEEKRQCGDIVIQIAAARSALGSVGKMVLRDEALECSSSKNHDKLDKLLKKLFDIS